MGKFNRMKQAEARQALEIVKGDAGEVVDFGAYALGCPSCGGFERQCKYHLGSAIIGSERVVSSDCNLPGRHLHWACQCGRMWITRCKFDSENSQEAPSSIETMHNVLRALAAGAGEDGMLVTDDEMLACASGTLHLEDSDDGKIVRYRPA